MKKKITYLSYDGILEPLGNSQVLNYLILLSKEFDITLFTFEKQSDLQKIERINRIQDICIENNIIWKFEYFIDFGVFRFANPFRYIFYILKHKKDFSYIFHARSFIPAFSAMLVSYINSKTKFIYDMRGYWVEEKVDVGKINKNSFPYKILTWLDKIIINKSSRVVTLSNISRNYIVDRYYLPINKVSTIYTCTDLTKFHLSSNRNMNTTCFGYVGTTVGWYRFEETLDFMRIALDSVPNSIFKIVSRDNKNDLINRIIKKNIDINKVQIVSANFENIEDEFIDIDIAIFFINQSFSKTASMPTKFGEFLASGIPCIVNSQIGDMGDILKSYPECGFVIEKFNDLEYINIIDKIKTISLSELSLKCRSVAEEYFSLDSGVKFYSEIYNNI